MKVLLVDLHSILHPEHYKSNEFHFNYRDEDILADSDSDDELQEDILMGADDQPSERPKKKARSKEEKYIYENADTIVDLADIKAMSNIASKYFKNQNSIILHHWNINSKVQTNSILSFQHQNQPNNRLKQVVIGKK